MGIHVVPVRHRLGVKESLSQDTIYVGGAICLINSIARSEYLVESPRCLI